GPGVPGSTSGREKPSASNTTAPGSASMRATVDLPAPIPPVSPTSSIARRIDEELERTVEGLSGEPEGSAAAFAPLQFFDDGLERNVLVLLGIARRRFGHDVHRGLLGRGLFGLERGLEGLLGGLVATDRCVDQFLARL